MQKAVFSSDELPAHLDDRSRFKLWHDIYAARFGECEMSALPERPFSARCEFVRFGDIGVVQFASTLDRHARTARQVAADARDDILIGFIRSRSIVQSSQRGRELALGAGQMLVFTNAEPSEARHQGVVTVLGLSMPRRPLLDLVAHVEDLLPSTLDASNAAMRHLGRYLDFVLAPEGIEEDAALIAHVETTIADLVALALGAGRETAEIARGRGLRAVRVQEILAEIKAGFADPAFSAHDVGMKLHLSPRYVQELLQGTEISFTERVLELRLQKASAMLADPRHDRLKVSEIALACGFNEVSYFNRCFRRRFGASPTQLRGRDGGES